ncbi:cytochrome c oxidase assembly protein [Sphingomonas sp. JC676]|uniref:cytochrome c oxidase assembly protein n=1 Tax=Sphingomonas sp. JC676 TaxID=2768065 RepID=UPI0016577BB9|nr:cytochrome c oxidase assembly protein [Sphingomonas sp. JC676]MBC9033812.1 cytochrome c oxidase assembly protein [Sphingomonas sp. JC676]
MRPLGRLVLAAELLVLGMPALAHDGHAHGQAPGWTRDPWITVPLAASLLLFAIGYVRLSRRAGRADYRRRGLFFAAGWLLLAAALVSPLHEAGERSFCAHMLEHELLMLAAAPLLVVGEPMIFLLWGFPAPARRAIGAAVRSPVLAAPWHALTAPVTATILQAAALWLWHMPLLFDLALAHEGWHGVQHLSFLLTALLFWSAMFGASRKASGGRALAALCLFATSLISGALGALMAFSESPWYARYAELGMAPYGLTPAEDQQVAGLIMWIPGGLVHALAALALVATLLGPGRTMGGADAR